MTMNLLARRMLPVGLAAAGLLAMYVPVLVADTANTQDTKTIYLSVLDSQGQPVTDLRADEMALAERNEAGQVSMRDIVDVRLAQTPLAIMLLADTSKATGGAGMSERGQVSGSELVRDIRVAFTSFVHTVNTASPESTMELMEFGQAAVTITKMTSDVSALEKGINRLFPKNNMPAVLLEAIHEAATILARQEKMPRRAIVALNVLPTDEQSRQQPNQMLQRVRDSGASVWAVSYNSGTTASDPRGIVFDALTKNTGGRRETIASPSALEQYMVQVAKALTNQYAVTYTRQAGEKPVLVQVGVTRQGLSLHTSIYPPR
ncbi:MAG: VWA domain-containing protein [Acidobacteria bacterium]|nr:VWA domain-containing protein [Acidobacteriota bacterium]